MYDERTLYASIAAPKGRQVHHASTRTMRLSLTLGVAREKRSSPAEYRCTSLITLSTSDSERTNSPMLSCRASLG